jgi:hypothetical protein
MSQVGPVEIGTASRRKTDSGIIRAGLSFQSWIEDHPAAAFTAFSVLYFAVVFSLSSFKLLWVDELFTLHIARLGSFGAIWHALDMGADPNPPVTYLLVHLSQSIFGSHEFAYRLPAAVGYWIGLLSLFLFLRRRVPNTWALAGTVLCAAMGAFEYSYESRSYGIFFGLAMLATLCWCWAIDPLRSSVSRFLALLGMVLALAVGISTNYFAVLAFLPIAFGEVVRTVSRFIEISRLRRSHGSTSSQGLLSIIDLRIWIGLLIAAAPLAAYRGMIAHSVARFAPYAWNKVSLDQMCDSYTEMVEIILYPLLVLFALGIPIVLVARKSAGLCASCRTRMLPRWLTPILDRASARPALPAHEAAAVFGFMLYPMLGYLMASIRGGMLSPRFVIPVCFGFAIAGTTVAFQLFGYFRLAGTVMLCFVSAWFLSREAVIGYWYEEQKQSFYKVLNHVSEADFMVPLNAPIAIPDPLLALTFQHYAPPAIAERVVFPVDFPAVRHFRGDDSPDENLWAGRNSIYTLRILTLARFMGSSGKYLLLSGDKNWLISDLQDHCYAVNRLPIDTRATDMGGFTPLAHGEPSFYAVSGNRGPDRDCPVVVPFRESDNLPQAKTYAPLPGGAP